ncbi:MAG: SDR family NAD(P)-dependent oxidoreductase [Promethearchaeota archaeon]|jgi:NAD(P)-dependent dehydrogenase (short-subunit alcohol dehydrogenase family)
MKEFKNKVVVITGAGSGIGLALAERCAKEGMKVVVADIDKIGLRRAQRKIKRIGGESVAVLTDVSKANDIEELAKKALEAYGAVHLLVNNAGIGNTKYTWEYTIKDWEWQLGVNLWGVIHGVRIFAPIMLKQNDESRIVNVSSMEGMATGSGPGGAVYGVSKHAVISLTETLRTDLQLKEIDKLKVSVVCPGFVNTRIFLGDIHRPEEFQNPPTNQVDDRGQKYLADMAKKFGYSYESGFEQVFEETKLMASEEAADIIFQGIREGKFYIFTHKDAIMKGLARMRFDEILKELDT